ncbi:MAG: carboxypeptidase regulatory-like domain-containing protein [Candidatus Sungbacteria bacterium]|nr:carboxypeptidase regulatory-like domain-containing protein [Candidatus Sungbacteria bacterium]
MKKFILGFVAALIVTAIVYFAYPIIRGFFSGGGPVSPENLKPGVKDYGSLRVEIFGRGNPLADVEVDLGEIGSNGPTGPMSFAVTDSSGVASFEKVPIGNYDIFFNAYHFPSEYNLPQPDRVSVSIVKDQITQKRIDLAPKQ